MPVFETSSFVRTSRRIMEGNLYVPDDIYEGEALSNQPSNGYVKGLENHNNKVDAPDISDCGPSDIIQLEMHPSQSSPSLGPPPVTARFASFIASTTYSGVPTPASAKLKELLLDYNGSTAFGASHSESTASILQSISSLNPAYSTKITATALTQGGGFLPQYAALLNGTFVHSLDFDDTYTPCSLHAGALVISATLAAAESVSSGSSSIPLP